MAIGTERPGRRTERRGRTAARTSHTSRGSGLPPRSRNRTVRHPGDAMRLRMSVLPPPSWKKNGSSSEVADSRDGAIESANELTRSGHRNGSEAR